MVTDTAEIIFLGTGCSWGTPTLTHPIMRPVDMARGHSAAIYKASSGEGILIDAGPQVIDQIRMFAPDYFTFEEGFKVVNDEIFGETARREMPIATATLNIKRAIITHPHDDHIGGVTFLKQVVGVSGKPLSIYGSPETIQYLRANSSFIFDKGAMMGMGAAHKRLKLTPHEIPVNGKTKFEDGTVLRTLQVRHGPPDGEATIFGLPGLVYAPDISHVTPEVIEFIAAGNPEVVALDCQTPNRKGSIYEPVGDDYGHLGIEEFLRCAAEAGNRSPGIKEFIAIHMHRTMTNGFLQEQFQRFRGDAGVRDDLKLTVGCDGMKKQLVVAQL